MSVEDFGGSNASGEVSLRMSAIKRKYCALFITDY